MAVCRPPDISAAVCTVGGSLHWPPACQLPALRCRSTPEQENGCTGCHLATVHHQNPCACSGCTQHALLSNQPPESACARSKALRTHAAMDLAESGSRAGTELQGPGRLIQAVLAVAWLFCGSAVVQLPPGAPLTPVLPFGVLTVPVGRSDPWIGCPAPCKDTDHGTTPALCRFHHL